MNFVIFCWGLGLAWGLLMLRERHLKKLRRFRDDIEDMFRWARSVESLEEFECVEENVKKHVLEHPNCLGLARHGELLRFLRLRIDNKKVAKDKIK